MPIQMKTPGVYIEEMSSGLHLINGVATSVAAFIGKTSTGHDAPPVLVRSWKQYQDVFGLSGTEGYLPYAVYGFFANGGSSCFVSSLSAVTENAIKGDPTKQSGLRGLEAEQTVSIVAVPDLAAKSVSSAVRKGAQQALVADCAKRNRVAILDLEMEAKVDAAVKAIGDLGLDPKQKPYAAVYYPALKVTDLKPANPSKPGTTDVPPSGHVAGVWARVDDERGVYKAPANEPLQGIDAPVLRLADTDQDTLNPVGVNCIRTFPGRGSLVWGARTLAVDTEWQYVNVRRLVCFLEESIRLGSLWAVFEPNDERLWSSVRRNVVAFLTDQWRRGALVGRTAAQAFSVQCDESNNPLEKRLVGQVTCDIGIAPAKPAEFVYFRISQIVAPSPKSSGS